MEPKWKFPAGNSQWLSLLLCGMGVGILTGLSVSPVVNGVLTALLGILSGLLAGAAGLTFRSDPANREQNKDEQSIPPESPFRVDARPCAIFILGIVLGAVSGVIVRTHNWLGVSQPAVALTVTPPAAPDRPMISIYEAGTDADVLKALVHESTAVGAPGPVHRTEPESAVSPPFTQGGVLFSNPLPGSECVTFRAKEGGELRAALESSSSKFVRNFSKNCPDNACRQALVNTLCSASH
jgi:hypothetical protein